MHGPLITYPVPGPPELYCSSRGSPSAEACVTRQRDTDPKTLVHLLVLVLYLGCDAETATVGQIWCGVPSQNQQKPQPKLMIVFRRAIFDPKKRAHRRPTPATVRSPTIARRTWRRSTRL